jgi:hypothetical protein
MPVQLHGTLSVRDLGRVQNDASIYIMTREEGFHELLHWMEMSLLARIFLSPDGV